MAPLRKALILAALAVIWELAARYQGNPPMLPTFGAAASALADSIQRDGLLWRAWAFAWRTLIAAELVFGVSSGAGGLGWYIFQARNELYTDRVSLVWPLSSSSASSSRTPSSERRRTQPSTVGGC